MRRFFTLIFLMMLTFNPIFGQIISQYVDTNSGTTPKGIEIWNNAGGTLDFSVNNLVIEKGVNGAAPSEDYTLSSGTLASGDVIVIGTSDMQATTEGNGATFYDKGFTFNGDDALVVKYGGTTTDVFGIPGSDPGSAWTGSGVSTGDQNISLMDGINTGDTDGWTDPSIRFETTTTDNSLTGFGIAPTTSPLPVELTSFSATPSNNSVELNWQTATEVNNYGFQVQRKKIKDKSESEWDDIGFVQGNGTTNSPKYYEFTDYELPNSESVDYRLKQIDNDGSYNYSKVVEVDLSNITGVDDQVEYTFALKQNYPNPFNPTTSIKYQVASTENVTLKVYDVLGNEVKTLVNETQNAGEYNVDFNASKLSSGMYIYKLQAGSFISVKKLMLMK